MEDNIYLDKVVEFLVRDTRIDYKKEEIQFPFHVSPFSLRFVSHSFSFFLSRLRFSIPPPFPKYCKSVYGLTEEEVEYVWSKYKDIILDKITNK